MSNISLSALEKEMANFDFDQVSKQFSTAHTKLATAESAADVKNEICTVWKKIRKFVVAAEVIPIVGKYITLVVQLLDSICPNP